MPARDRPLEPRDRIRIGRSIFVLAAPDRKVDRVQIGDEPAVKRPTRVMRREEILADLLRSNQSIVLNLEELKRGG